MPGQALPPNQDGVRPPVGRRRRWRRVLLAVACLILSGLGGVLGVEWNARRAGDREVRAAVIALEQSDPGWRLPDIEAQRPPLPDEQNSGLRVQAVRKLLPEPLPRSSRALGPQVVLDFVLGLVPELGIPSPQQLDKEQLQNVRAELEKHADALREGPALAEMPYGSDSVHWTLDYIHMPIEELFDRLPVGGLLTHDGVLRAQENDLAGACRSVRAVTNTGRSIGDRYLLLGCLIRTTLLQLAIEDLERVLAQGEPEEESLAALQHLLEQEEEETPASFLTALREERALMHRCYEALERGDLYLFGFLAKQRPTLYGRAMVYLSGGTVRHSHAVYLQLVTEWIDIARLPTEEQAEASERCFAKPIDLARAPLLLLLPGLKQMIGTLARKLAVLRSARVAVALERYRRKHHDWPTALDVLVHEGLLPAIPQDPYTGRPLRSRWLKDGLVIYSVGPDKEDDLGNIDRKHLKAPGTDLGFRLWDPAQRRQPPPPKAARPPALPPDLER
jgi:hypothetical protein